MGLIKKLEVILEEDNINSETNLKGCDNWDSLSILSIVAMVDKEYNITLTMYDIMGITTVTELESLIKSKK